MSRRFWLQDESETNHADQYFERSRIKEETQITIKYLERIIRWLHGMVDVGNSNERQRRDPEISSGTKVYRAFDTPELRDVLQSAKQAAHTLVERDLSDIPTPLDLKGQVDADYVPAAPIYVMDARLTIHGGFLERFRPEPIITESDDHIVCRFISISRIKDVLDRDHHQVGWHYHYCKSDGARSDTILTFDRHNTAPKSPLFWEKHREKNCSFHARANAWRHDKRSSAYSACVGDLNRDPAEFRRPSNEAEPVWPVTAILSKR